MSHPIRKAEIHTFCRVEETKPNFNPRTGVTFIAMFFPYKTYPMYFSGHSRSDVIAKAEAFRAEAIEKHEADCIRRQELSRKAKERAAKKKEGAV